MMPTYTWALMLAMFFAAHGEWRVTIPAGGGAYYLINAAGQSSGGGIEYVEPVHVVKPPTVKPVPIGVVHFGGDPRVVVPRILRKVLPGIRPIVDIQPCPPGEQCQ
jgi:hypothetical protein